MGKKNKKKTQVIPPVPPPRAPKPPPRAAVAAVAKQVAKEVEKKVEKAVQKQEGTALSREFRKVASATITGGLDIVGNLHPKLKAAREGIRAVTGFNERRVEMKNSGIGGGPVVRTMNAPVAFARNQLSVGRKTVKAAADFERRWMCDLAQGVTTAGVANTYSATAGALSPSTNFFFPNFYVDNEEWEKWRPVEMILHYCHFAPTSVQAAVMLAFNEDSNATEVAGVDATTSKLMGLAFSAMGSCYEDFSLRVKPLSWSQGTWLYNDVTAGADLRLNSPGDIIFATDANGTTSTPVGYLYVELGFEVTGRRVPYSGAGMLTRAFRAVPYCKETERDAFIAWVYDKIASDFRKQKPATDIKSPSIIAEFRAALAKRSPPAPQGSAANVNLSQQQLLTLLQQQPK